LGLAAGPVPPRVDAKVKAGLLALVAHAASVGGWSVRRAATGLREHLGDSPLARAASPRPPGSAQGGGGTTKSKT